MTPKIAYSITLPSMCRILLIAKMLCMRKIKMQIFLFTLHHPCDVLQALIRLPNVN